MPVNDILKMPLSSMGSGFIPKQFIPADKDEYHLRDMQERSGIDYRHLTAFEIEVLVRNRNTSDDWNQIYVSDAFNPEQVKSCKFYGLVRIGKLEPYCLSFSNLKLPVGLYNSTIISCDFGDNVVVTNVRYLAYYIIGNEAMIVNVNEMQTTNHAKFGNGIVKDGEDESIRIWLEICNENAGRSIIPFNGMLPGDAYLWSRNRDDKDLLSKFKQFTEQKFDKQRGYYGKVGHRTIVKNCAIIKDVWIGSDAYIKGANKLKNLTINSGPEGKTQIGEGCEMVNGIVDYGCKVFYGVKAVRFIMASNSQLKYGARLINSYLGNNATISCCEVLNSLIFPSHEQHHNNSFLCAALVMGQSNIAAGATLGSNHNSRGADGEFIAKRGFWPGLCVSIKHNSQLASFTILAKGDYPAELNIPVPFSLISTDVSYDRLVVMPAYWFMYNMYALARNSWKYIDRDKRTNKTQHIEYDYLAPDTVNEMFETLSLLEELTGEAYLEMHQPGRVPNKVESVKQGKRLFTTDIEAVDSLEITTDRFENAKRKTVFMKVANSYTVFRNMIKYYGTLQLIELIKHHNAKSIADVINNLPSRLNRGGWVNIGGQLIPSKEVESMKLSIKKGKIKSWDGIHEFYELEGKEYTRKKMIHGLSSLQEITGIKLNSITGYHLKELLLQSVETKNWLVENIRKSREKDYSNPYRNMVYENDAERDAVLGKLDDNTFINEQKEELEAFTKEINSLIKKLKLK